MKLNKKFVASINKIFIGSFILVSYASITLYSRETCKDRSIFDPKQARCKVVNILSAPPNAFLSAALQTRLFLKQLKTGFASASSGLLAHKYEEVNKRFIGIKPGFTFNYKPGTRKNAGYLLLSRPSPVDGTPLIDLWDLNYQKKLFSYDLDLDEIAKNLDLKRSSKNKLRAVHPLLLNDGSLVTIAEGFVENQDPILKFDSCGNYIGLNINERYHHSLEVDSENRIYAPIYNSTENIDRSLYSKDFYDDGFSILDSDLKNLAKFSLLNIYKNNGYFGDIHSEHDPGTDPFHLNDVQPFKTNDDRDIVLLSIRNNSRILAFDVTKNNALWSIDRAVSQQHDIDIFPDKNNEKITISIFDNNVFRYNYKKFTTGNKYVTFSGLPTNQRSYPFTISDRKNYEKYSYSIYDFNDLLPNLRPITRSEGRFEYIPSNDSLMIEESNFGRLFEIEKKTGIILWQFFNKQNENSIPFMLSGSRRIRNLPENIPANLMQTCNKPSLYD